MKKYYKILIPSLYIGVVAVMVLCIVTVINGIKSYSNLKPTYDYTIDEVFQSDIVSPVVKTESDKIVKPYMSDSVKIGKYFYDYNDESNKQENSLIVYNNTYIQNTGVDYIDEDSFEVISVLDGEIIGIEDNPVYGKTITIKHNDNLKTIYSNLTDVLVNVGYKVSKGESIANSDVSKFDKDEKYLLHFEVNYKDKEINPEEFYNMKLNELE